MENLERLLQDQINASPKKAISFSDWMEAALYHERWGYYQQQRVKIGKDGDFYTSPMVGDVFGRALALAIAEIGEKMFLDQRMTLVEVGGGNGRLACQILDALQGNPLYNRLTYTIVEQSPTHRQMIEDMVQRHEKRVHIIPSLTALSAFQGIVLSNELLDAFPVHWLQFTDEAWEEIYVRWDEERQRFIEVLYPIEDEQIHDWVQQEQVQAMVGQRMEVNLAMLQWQQQISQLLERGYLITIDYGLTREQLYLPQRKHGTLRAFKEHQLDDELLSQPGQKDITSHVNFSQWMERGEEHKLHTLRFMTQREFLLSAGILQLIPTIHEREDPFSSNYKQLRAIQQLILPGGMGDQFMVCVQGKGEVSNQLSIIRPFKFTLG
ncbi:class I SAM-dependent methyltransferase [Rubeoparvulum massiliense]|uniref:class I SAM-dependent methyltransferase n=1 Tax=Rubeoparvulum massiliense TaxID=1631346 RepID=UPI00065E4994|nr:SAM-dependent methyltransferase [Rubeoparvulum massiliense]